MSDKEIEIVYDQGEEPNQKPMIARFNDELNRELSDPKVMGALLATTFKGLDATKAKQAMLEGMIRGYKFKDFLVKNIYAVKFGDGYALVTSIDDARKRGMKNGVVGKSAPIYTYKEDKTVDSCEITIKRQVNGMIGEFTALVYFDEYYKEGKTWNGKYTPSMWDNKPRTMIAKVAEMHALRMACPEDLSQIYVEEEFELEAAIRNRPSERFAEATNETKAITTGNLRTNAKKEDPKNGGEPANREQAEEVTDQEEPPE